MRPYQLVVWGASGFVGKLVCEHIARDYQGKVRWALAGRSQEKLDAVKASLVEINPACAEVSVLLADLKDQASVQNVTSQTEVVITTAGPYARIGMPIVEACADTGTHYCDLTGEPQFVRASIRAVDARAKATGAKIVHCCGYDSVPSDLATLQLVDYSLRKHGQPPAQVSLLQRGVGGVSGGTIDSLLLVLTESWETLQELAKPYCLDPPGSLYASGTGPDTAIPMTPLWSEASRSWTAPFFMAAVNEPVVRRSNALLDYAYGEKFSYRERFPTGSYLTALAACVAIAFINLLCVAASRFPILRKMLTAAGSGPGKNGSFKAEAYGLLPAAAGSSSIRMVSVLEDKHRDPGYWSTSRMILEVALCLALDKDAVAADPYAGKRAGGGVLTPASACGLVLLRRLRAADYGTEVKDM